MTILDRIVADTREVVAARKATAPPETLESKAAFAQSRRSLEKALRTPGPAIIAEIKKASPSQGIIRSDFRPVEIARQYQAGGACAVSVLTEPRHFQGSLDDLQAARQAVSVPVLRKDFIIDPYQLTEARACGADAVLLIAAILSRTQLRDLLQAAHALDLDALIEVYAAQELDRIDFDEARIVGVNNRDLRTFDVDVRHSLRVFEQVPNSVVRVSESGLASGKEVRLLRERGVDAFLIGETFMRAEQPGDALTKLLREANRADA